jgi:hypothetical protein
MMKAEGVEKKFNEVLSAIDEEVFSIETLSINNELWMIIFTKEEKNHDRSE